MFLCIWFNLFNFLSFAFEFIFILNNNRGKLFLSGLTLIFSYLFGLIINLIINRKKNETGFKDYDEYKTDILDLNEDFKLIFWNMRFVNNIKSILIQNFDWQILY